MRVLVLGGYGFIGLAVMRRLVAAGHDVVGLGRSGATGRRLFSKVEWISLDLAAVRAPAQWMPYLKSVDVVVNASGALQDGARDHVALVQDRAIVAAIAACEDAGVRRFVQISAPSAHVGASTEFMRSKARADARLKLSRLAWVILRPGLVVGPSAYGGTALIRALAGFPWVLPLAFADRSLQCVALSDVADVVFEAVAGRLPSGTDLDLVEPDSHTLGEVVARFRVWLGVAPARAVVALPPWSMLGVARAADAVGFLGWRSPLRTTAIRAVAEGVRGDSKRAHAVLGRNLSSLDETLERMPATVQERWFARLYLLMPIMIAVLAALWLASGVVTLVQLDHCAATIQGPSVSAEWAHSLIAGAAIVDIALGLGVLFRPTARATCCAMAALTAIYLIAGGLLRPDLPIDPLGASVKALPTSLLALVTAVVLEER